MPFHDAAAAAALGAGDRFPAYFLWLDILDAPVRITSAGYDLTLAGTGDGELDGDYEGLSPDVLEISPVTFGENGSGTVTVTLSGIADVDDDLLDIVAERSRWRGRTLRLWKAERDADGAIAGAIVPYATAYATNMEIVPGAEEQRIVLKAEHYLAALTAEPSNRSYLGQAEYDPADQSAKATIGAANGVKAGPGRTTADSGFAAVVSRIFDERPHVR